MRFFVFWDMDNFLDETGMSALAFKKDYFLNSTVKELIWGQGEMGTNDINCSR